jgi:hypothetical protein
MSEPKIRNESKQTYYSNVTRTTNTKMEITSLPGELPGVQISKFPTVD